MELLTRTLVELADTLVPGFDEAEFLDRLARRCADIVAAQSVGVLLDDPSSGLRLVASSDEQADVIQALRSQATAGPGYDAFHQRRLTQEITDDAAGSGLVCGIPMHLRDRAIGALVVLRTTPDLLSSTDMVLAQALADVATVGLLNWRDLRDATTVIQQLETAFESRGVIEQAKGVLAERTGVTVAQAFELLRARARTTNRRIADVAQAVVTGADLVDP